MSDALALPSGDFGAYLFDLDGTLVDNMPRNYAAWNRLVSEAGGQLTEELFYAWGGLPLAEVIARLNAQFGISMDPVQAVARKAELDLLTRNHRHRCRACLLTSSKLKDASR